MTMVSYAQDAEDVLLRRAFPADRIGSYIDVGANDPVGDSVTKHFYDRGWRGVNIEPIRGLHERLVAARPGDINLNIGLGERAGQFTFYESSALPGWSTFSGDLAASYRVRGMEVREYPVPVRTLGQVCEEHALGAIDFLKVDAEGFEREVLAGADWSRWRPKIVVVEDAWPERWESLLWNAGYRLAHRSRLNRFYARVEDHSIAEALRSPVGPADDFVRHRHAQVLAALNDQFDRGEDFGPAALRVALWLRRQATRHPALAITCRKFLRAVD